MGRYSGQGRDMIEQTGRITLDALKTWGYLHLGYKQGSLTFSSGGQKTGGLGIAVRLDEWGGAIRFNYLLGYDKKPVEYEHRIEAFPCYYGGHRFYFRCRHCSRRVMALYLSGGYYACRHCHRLAYEVSQRHRSPYELIRRAGTIEDRAEELRKHGHPRKANRLLKRGDGLYQLGEAELLARDELERGRARERADYQLGKGKR